MKKNAPTTYFFFNTAVNLISEPRNHSKFCTLRPNPAPGRSSPFKTLYCSFTIHFFNQNWNSNFGSWAAAWLSLFVRQIAIVLLKYLKRLLTFKILLTVYFAFFAFRSFRMIPQEVVWASSLKRATWQPVSLWFNMPNLLILAPIHAHQVWEIQSQSTFMYWEVNKQLKMYTNFDLECPYGYFSMVMF